MKIMVIAAHPDDEVLGVGGTILRHVRQGDSVDIVIFGEGAASRGHDPGEVSHLRECAVRAARLLGANPPTLLGMPDNRLDSMDLLDIIQAIETVIEKHRPEVIYTHHRGDLNIDHRIVHEAVRTAARPLPGSTVRAIHAFETVSSTEWGEAPFRPVSFVDISAVLREKMQVLEEYVGEMRPFPHARSLLAVEALARVRGAGMGLEAAEAFEVVMQRDPGFQ